VFLCGCTSLSKSFIVNMAEGVGFEPTVRSKPYVNALLRGRNIF
jgi:hypothetical protein